MKHGLNKIQRSLTTSNLLKKNFLANKTQPLHTKQQFQKNFNAVLKNLDWDDLNSDVVVNSVNEKNDDKFHYAQFPDLTPYNTVKIAELIMSDAVSVSQELKKFKNVSLFAHVIPVDYSGEESFTMMINGEGFFLVKDDQMMRDPKGFFWDDGYKKIDVDSLSKWKLGKKYSIGFGATKAAALAMMEHFEKEKNNDKNDNQVSSELESLTIEEKSTNKEI